MCETVFDIAALKFGFRAEMPLNSSPAFQPFYSEGIADYQIFLKKTDRIVPVTGETLYEDSYMLVKEGPEGTIFRYYRDSTLPVNPYAQTCYLKKENQVFVEYLPEVEKSFRDVQCVFGHICWEELLMQKNRYMLHSACIKTDFGGILFCGPSGAGKSTQADLWCRYEKASLLNGDRPILYREKGIWRAFGSPYAGSSRCHKKESVDISAIIFVKQASSCRLRLLGLSEAFKKIYSCLTINTWNYRFVEASSNLALQLAEDISVYEWECTPDQRAVVQLKKALQEKRKSYE